MQLHANLDISLYSCCLYPIKTKTQKVGSKLGKFTFFIIIVFHYSLVRQCLWSLPGEVLFKSLPQNAKPVQGGEIQEGKSPSSLLFQPISQFFNFLPTFWRNFSLFPKLGLKIGSGQHTTPAVSHKVSFLTFRASPLHQHTAQRLCNHRMSCLRRFL